MSREQEGGADAVEPAMVLLTNRLRQSGDVWMANVAWRGRDDIEFSIEAEGHQPSDAQLRYAAACLASLDSVVADCERLLNAVPEGHADFPSMERRRWYFEGLHFEDTEPTWARAEFMLDQPEGEWDYVYVVFFVGIRDGHAVNAWTGTR